MLVPIGSFDLHASYEMMKGKGSISLQEGKQHALGGAYNLVKCTAVDATYASFSNTNPSFRAANGMQRADVRQG